MVRCARCRRRYGNYKQRCERAWTRRERARARRERARTRSRARWARARTRCERGKERRERGTGEASYDEGGAHEVCGERDITTCLLGMIKTSSGVVERRFGQGQGL